MKAKEFAISLVEQLSAKYPDSVFGYSYDLLVDQHVFQVYPSSLFGNEAYANDEAQLIFEFISEFPCESILFISHNSDDSIPKVENIIQSYGLEPKYYVFTNNELVEPLALAKDLPYLYPKVTLDSGNILILSDLLAAPQDQFYWSKTDEAAGTDDLALAA